MGAYLLYKAAIFCRYRYSFWGTKTKNAVQKSSPPEAKNFRDFHSQMQFSLNKLHFPEEKSANFLPAPSAPAKFFAKFS